MARAEVKFTDGGITAKLRNFDKKLEHRVDVLMDYEASYTTAYIRGRAPWTDRTGAARNGLIALANSLGSGSFELLMSYSVYYGIYLENANNGRYAVIGPAMRVIGEKVMSDLRHIIERMEA